MHTSSDCIVSLEKERNHLPMIGRILTWYLSKLEGSWRSFILDTSIPTNMYPNRVSVYFWMKMCVINVWEYLLRYKDLVHIQMFLGLNTAHFLLTFLYETWIPIVVGMLSVSWLSSYEGKKGVLDNHKHVVRRFMFSLSLMYTNCVYFLFADEISIE